MSPRRRRSERKPSLSVDEDRIARARQEVATAAMFMIGARAPRPVPLAVVIHASSVEFLAAYNRYLDDYPSWIDVPPLSAGSWRARVIDGYLA